MIGHIEGIALKVGEGSCIIEAGGIGYKIAATGRILSGIRAGQRTSLWTYLAVRETALDLYGFVSEEEQRIFELLLTVSGIGPKSALAILYIATVEALRSAISQGNASYLTKVSGVGRKTAEKIVLELQDKIGIAGSSSTITGDEEALEALCALGYSAQEAREALRAVPAVFEKASDRVREALRIVGAV